MRKKSAPTTTERDARIVAMRGLGCSLIDIAETLSISLSTVERTLKRCESKKGELLGELIMQSREEVLSTLKADKQLQLMAATTATANPLSKKGKRIAVI